MRRLRFASVSLIFCACLAAQVAHAASGGDLTLLETSPSGITFIYQPPPPSWEYDGAGFYPVISGTALDRTPGRLRISGRIAYVALPPGTQSVEAVLRSHSGERRLTPPARRVTKSDAPAAAGSLYPRERVVVDGVFTHRGLRMARLILHPLQFVTAAAEVSFLSEMTVHVEFAPLSSAPPASFSRDAASRGADPFARIYEQILINPEQGQEWRVPVRLLARADTAESYPFAGTDQWLAIRTREEGAVAVTGADLQAAGIDLSAVDPSQFRLLSGTGEQLSTLMSGPPPVFREVAIHIEAGDDGIFDVSDRFLFWAPGLNRWDLDADGNLIDVVNRYDRDNVFWFAAGGAFTGDPRRIAEWPALPPESGEFSVFSAPVRVRHEEDRYVRVGSLGLTESYYTWYWQNLRSAVMTLNRVINPEPGRPARIETGSFAGSAGLDPARLISKSILYTADVFLPRSGEDRTAISIFEFAEFDPFAGYLLDFEARPGNSQLSTYHLDYYSVEYDRRLDLSAGAFRFSAPDTSAVATYVIANAEDLTLWNVTDPAAPRLVTGLSSNGSVARFAADPAGMARQVYYAFGSTAPVRPQSITVVTPEDIHAPASGADYVLIGPRAFAAAAADFVSYRAAADGLTLRYVALEDVYDGFSFGLSDPVAIRRFLRHAHYHWPGEPPVYALLVGDGSYDFLDRSGAHPVNYVPPYVTEDSHTARNLAVVADESFVYFSDRPVLDAEGNTADSPFPDMIIGRWPVRNTGEIQAITDKILRYESNENLGPWRSRVLLVADDEFGDRSAGSVNETIHINRAEGIAQNTIPPRIDLQKIYLTEYPFNNPGCTNPGATGCRKPAAKEAIVSALNAGVAVFDYVGHGNEDLFAHERVFERATDLPRLTNAGTATAVLTFSCSIGFFDHPANEGLAEEWLRLPVGGAVAVVSATRQSEALANADLNEEVFDLLFNKGVTGLGEAVYTAKILRQYRDPRCQLFGNCPDGPPCPCDNDRGYMLLGDPAMKLGMPLLRVRIDTLTPDSLVALQLTRVAGSITDTAGVIQDDFDGSVFVTVRDVPRARSYEISDFLTLEYDLPGGTLYRGRTDVVAGRFDFSFIVPRDVAYGQVGARVLCHATTATNLAGGASVALRIAAAAGDVTDTTGPEMQLLTAAEEPVGDGFRMAEGSELLLRLSDESGINLTGAPGHRILVSTGDATEPLVDLTEDFTYDPGAADKGTAQFSLDGVALGPLHLEIKAWDNANNSSLLSFDLEVTEPGAADDFEVTEFLNYPNPLSDETTFYFRATREIEEATIRIFTVAGRLIWEAAGARDGETGWNATDRIGDPVANGVYLVQVEAHGRVVSGGESVDKKAYREIKVVVSR